MTLDLAAFAPAHPHLEELGFSDADVTLEEQGISPRLSLTRLHLKNSTLRFQRSRLQHWVPDLEILIASNSEPDHGAYLSLAVLSCLPPKPRQLVYGKSFDSLFNDLFYLRPVQLPATLEFLHLIVYAETNRRGQLSLDDAGNLDMMHNRVRTCTGGLSLVIKLDWVSKRKKSADELYEELAERCELVH